MLNDVVSVVYAVEAYGIRKVYVISNMSIPGVKDMPVESMNVYVVVSAASDVGKKRQSIYRLFVRLMVYFISVYTTYSGLIN